MNGKLDDPKAAPKTRWLILDKFLHNKKIPFIPLVFVNDKPSSDFQKKADIFNSHFASQITSIKNTSKYQTSFDLSEDGIILIIKNVNVDKTHGCDNINKNEKNLR